jgi:hypothetical protein
MASLIDREPSPRAVRSACRRAISPTPCVDLPRAINRPSADFFDILDSRRSGTGSTLPIEVLSSLLWHSTRLRDRRPGRFGIGSERRSAPSAGGLHPLRLLVLPVDGPLGGIYDDHRHALAMVNDAAFELNSVSIEEILGTNQGTTIQLAADTQLVGDCYKHPESLIWRDAGALAVTICLVATALSLTATLVGRVGDAIVTAAGPLDGFAGAGAVHVGTSYGGNRGRMEVP